MTPTCRRGGHPISFDSTIDRAVFDAAVLADILRIIPPDRIRGYLRELDSQLQLLIESASSDDDDLGKRAHKIGSQAAMLGLTRMTQCARALEDACRSGAGQAEALIECRAAAGDIELHAMPAALQCPK
jgi:hypothetical protein